MPISNVVKILSDLVSVDSQSHKDNTPIIELISSWFKSYETEMQEWVRKDGVKGKNLIVKIPGENSDFSLVFVCHMDTVPTSSAWETDPFILEEIEGKLYGLGTCDTKGGVAALIEAVLKLEGKPKSDVYLVFDGDEESSTTGAKKFNKNLSIKNPKFIFIEPTNKEILLGQKAVLSFELITHGTSMHASLSDFEKANEFNAINKMIKILNFLENDINELSKYKNDLFGVTTQNLGIISGGTAENVFADKCRLTVDRRLIPDQDPFKEMERLKKSILELDKGIEIKNIQIETGFKTENNSGFVNIVKNCVNNVIPDVKLGIFKAWSEAGIFAKYKDVLILGPGNLDECAHKANEYIESQDLFEYTKIFRNILENI